MLAVLLFSHRSGTRDASSYLIPGTVSPLVSEALDPGSCANEALLWAKGVVFAQSSLGGAKQRFARDTASPCGGGAHPVPAVGLARLHDVGVDIGRWAATDAVDRKNREHAHQLFKHLARSDFDWTPAARNVSGRSAADQGASSDMSPNILLKSNFDIQA